MTFFWDRETTFWNKDEGAPVEYPAENPPAAEAENMSEESCLQKAARLKDFRENLQVGDRVWWEDDDPHDNATGVFTVTKISEEDYVSADGAEYSNLDVNRDEIFPIIPLKEREVEVLEFRRQKEESLKVFRENLNIGDEVWYLDPDGDDEDRADFSGTYTITELRGLGEAVLGSDYYGKITVLEENLFPKGDGTRLCMQKEGVMFDDKGREWISTYCDGRQLRAHALPPETNPITSSVCNFCQMKRWGETFL